MKGKQRFASEVVDSIRDGKILGIRAGTEPHRFIGIWAVVVERRVFVRSWSLKPRSWYRTFLEEPRGTINVPLQLLFTTGFVCCRNSQMGGMSAVAGSVSRSFPRLLLIATVLFIVIFLLLQKRSRERMILLPR